MPSLQSAGTQLIAHPLKPLIEDYTSAIARRVILCSDENIAELQRATDALNKALKETK
jgi:hypothetical protein